ncbi:MAG: EamA family transporter [Clostridia bacterium]|nr:EamA family transporter [Clostridia bacterium]MBQ9997119.1 EamA family transporter [Clostridia bacterium]
MKQKPSYIYPLLNLMCAIFFSLGGTLIKLVPWSSMSISAGRAMIAAVMLLIYMKIRHHKIVLNKAVVIGGCAIGFSSILYVVSNKLTTAANAILIQYTAPVFIIFYIWLMFKEKPKKIDIIATIVISLGEICFFIDSLSVGGMLGNILALIGGAIYAVVFMMKRFEGADTLSSVLVGCLICSAAGLPWLVTETEFTPVSIGGILAIGIVQYGLGYICMAEGLMGTPPLTASLISMVEPIINPILAAIVLGELLTPMALVGAAIVIVSVILYNIAQEKLKPKIPIGAPNE